jgi:gliding motility-associated-like protein
VVRICQGDEFTDTVNVFVVPFVPNAFTPDNDGLNDVFRMTGLPVANITQFSFSIYDRWGRMVFSTNDVTEGWNGAWNGKECPAGAYAWILIYNNEKKTITNKGVITLVR